jgi:nucleoid-associated protein YgaU
VRPLVLVACLLAPAVLLAVALSTAACGDKGGEVRRSTDVAPGLTSDGCVVLEPGAPVTHRVSRGETLSSIALEVYGDAALWREIAQANPDVVRPDGGVDAGVELIIPFDGR